MTLEWLNFSVYNYGHFFIFMLRNLPDANAVTQVRDFQQIRFIFITKENYIGFINPWNESYLISNNSHNEMRENNRIRT